MADKKQLEKTVSAMAGLIAGDNKQRQVNLEFWLGAWVYDIKLNPNPKKVCEECKKSKAAWLFEYIKGDYEVHKCTACVLLEAIEFIEKMKDAKQP
jgi:hypothetical protein